MGLDDVSNLIIWLPPLQEQVRIVGFIDREGAKVDTLITKIREAVDKLREYRTALISAAVTGKIDIRERAFGSNQTIR